MSLREVRSANAASIVDIWVSVQGILVGLVSSSSSMK